MCNACEHATDRRRHVGFPMHTTYSSALRRTGPKNNNIHVVSWKSNITRVRENIFFRDPPSFAGTAQRSPAQRCCVPANEYYTERWYHTILLETCESVFTVHLAPESTKSISTLRDASASCSWTKASQWSLEEAVRV